LVGTTRPRSGVWEEPRTLVCGQSQVLPKLLLTAIPGSASLSRARCAHDQEFKTLKYLIQNAHRVISRDELLNEVWEDVNYPSPRTVDNRILKLRQKLERDPSRPVHFRTVHGAGYKFLP
jgi:DNA-binding response OmpR family regulator